VSGVPPQFGLLNVRLLAIDPDAPVYADPLTEASVITIDCVADETYVARRELADVVAAGTVMVKCAVAVAFTGAVPPAVTGALAGSTLGAGPDCAPPPPPQAARTTRRAAAKGARVIFATIYLDGNSLYRYVPGGAKSVIRCTRSLRILHVANPFNYYHATKADGGPSIDAAVFLSLAELGIRRERIVAGVESCYPTMVG
jgi:hypothetical protein